MSESTSFARKKLKTKKELDRRRRASGPLRITSSSSGEEEEEEEVSKESRKRKASSSSSGSERRGRKRRKSGGVRDVERFRESAINKTMQVDAARLPLAVRTELSERGKVFILR
jgi:DUF4097 and DUF4098 domain-containing protein YvlB